MNSTRHFIKADNDKEHLRCLSVMILKDTEANIPIRVWCETSA